MERLDVVARWLPGPGVGRPGDAGLFPPGTVARRLNAETALVLGGGRALLLQLAHPSVAAAVADHSAFRRDPYGRLANTLGLTLTVAFGDAAQRTAAARRVGETHRRVVGDRDGVPYRALDPDLLLWVHATLVDTALATYERFVRRIPPAVAERYLREMDRQAIAFGVPEDRLPASPAAFRGYVDDTVAGLLVGDGARDLARAVLRPPAPPPLRPLVGTAALVTAGLLPPRIRDAYGIRWSAGRERSFHALAASVRAIVPLLPDILRRWPHARDADRRLA